MATEQKSELSYRYWSRGNVVEPAPANMPQKLSAEQLAALEQQVPRANPAASAWNAAGTWEERNWTGWASERLKVLLTGLRVPLPSGGELCTTGWSSCSGDATVMTVRGKLRHGFDFHVHISFTATLPPTDELDEREVKGTVQIQDASREAVQSEELELVVDVDKPSAKAAQASDAEKRGIAAAAKGKALHALLLKVLQTLDAEMLARVAQG